MNVLGIHFKRAFNYIISFKEDGICCGHQIHYFNLYFNSINHNINHNNFQDISFIKNHKNSSLYDDSGEGFLENYVSCLFDYYFD